MPKRLPDHMRPMVEVHASRVAAFARTRPTGPGETPHDYAARVIRENPEVVEGLLVSLLLPEAALVLDDAYPED